MHIIQELTTDSAVRGPPNIKQSVVCTALLIDDRCRVYVVPRIMHVYYVRTKRTQ